MSCISLSEGSVTKDKGQDLCFFVNLGAYLELNTAVENWPINPLNIFTFSSFEAVSFPWNA